MAKVRRIYEISKLLSFIFLLESILLFARLFVPLQALTTKYLRQNKILRA